MSQKRAKKALGIQPLAQAIPGVNEQITANAAQVSDIAGRVGGISDQFGQFAQGEDPVIAAQRARSLESGRGLLQRQGITGTNAIDELSKINRGFDESALARRDQQLGTQAALLGGQTSLLGTENEFRGTALQNLTAIPQLSIAGLNAATAGQSSGGKK